MAKYSMMNTPIRNISAISISRIWPLPVPRVRAHMKYPAHANRLDRRYAWRRENRQTAGLLGNRDIPQGEKSPEMKLAIESPNRCMSASDE